ncbi:hypothetical protein NC661_04235 [Aquibacillus koreensis]|uniref:Uncharacterized protein n=1 Tax=Aquibacillus koreensis TaxID=279446 RepID=A0A9X3WJQ2_9BACI|nr:hypothetical protein [Aquibacillus koreensis]MCT2534818.1 hypothetical protein [Aquibacillus koreensis]MDC3419571.1 hypothetical protein [Aquibacillus koreensis]
MLFAENTPNYAGVKVYGDFMDFESLYDSLHEIVGEEGEFTAYQGGRLRVLGVCYDIRHALMGNRDFNFVDNGLDQDKMKRISMITSDKNVYMSFHVYWPEVIFVNMVLNDFINIYAAKKSNKAYRRLEHKNTIWDATIANVRMFQAAIAKTIKSSIAETSHARVMGLMNREYSDMAGFATQYLDLLNVKFLNMEKEKRQKNITVMIKRLAEQGKDYQDVKSEVREAAKKYNCSTEDISLKEEYPEDVEW